MPEKHLRLGGLERTLDGIEEEYVRALVQKLPSYYQRVVFELYYFLEMSRAEIARSLGTREQEIQRLLSASRENMEKLLQGKRGKKKNISPVSTDIFSRPNSEIRQLIEFADRSLAPRHRRVCRLYYIERLSVAEISSLLGKPKNTVNVYLHEAREILKRAIIIFDQQQEELTEDE